ncbi:RNA-binding domain-containing protein [Fomitiporia mediterranea MF3/22]|uniref:RNA-binding domain-containing protein n=1 Tax=Fomitiporia mediterranea (strain MF3/22) TaxID=694068 RepID=UPI00044087E5|nr:RNA-binding domain-containing protein [Fomitiporia mediterranea MF3/22]EJD02199.1 RNA-binding domain-containing protein [Fomitiporia mediterranea MF3/22]
MARRLYLGKLPPDTRTDEVTKYFDGFGPLVDVRVMTGFGFVEFESSRDAEDALRDIRGKPFLGSNIVVEFAKENRGRRNDYEDRSFAPRRRPAGIRISVDNISKDTSWQDLKDFGREAGSVSFADIDREVPGRGILEYASRDDAEQAVKELDGKELRGQPVHVTMDEDRGGPDNFRRDDGYRGDRYRDRGDRYDRNDRFSARPPRRGRSGSPPPRRDEGARSPPPRRDYDDRKNGRDEPYERRRDDRRRDDRESRFEDRPSRSNGDGWSR